MKTQELIKQAEELLKVHDTAFTNERDEAIIATFARKHMQEILDKLKRYEDALYFYATCKFYTYVGSWSHAYTIHDHGEVARKALMEE